MGCSNDILRWISYHRFSYRWSFMGCNKQSRFLYLLCISYALAFPSYFLWNTTGYLLSSENRKKVLGVLGIIGRYLLAILAIALCFIYLYYTSQSYYYTLIPPTVVLIVYSFVILYIAKKAKKEG